MGHRDDLLALGILIVPKADFSKQTLWEYLLGPNVPAEQRQERLQSILQVQRIFSGKSVRRRQEPQKQGVVDFIVPCTDLRSAMRTPPSDDSIGQSRFEALVKWRGRKATLQNLNSLELIPQDSEPNGSDA